MLDFFCGVFINFSYALYLLFFSFYFLPVRVCVAFTVLTTLGDDVAFPTLHTIFLECTTLYMYRRVQAQTWYLAHT